MSEDTTALSVGGDVEITKIKLTNYKGQAADISGIFIEFEIYEDVYSHSLSGSITIVDTHDLIRQFPLIGEETLEISFKTPGFDSKYEITQKFSVYKLSNIILVSAHRQTYTLYFTTPEAMTDLNKRISKAFTGTPDSIIKRVLGSDGLKTDKKSTIESSNNNIKVVPTFWNPFKCINYLSSRAQSIDNFKASNFVFFETNKQYKFRSVNNIFSDKPKCSYVYNNDNARNPEGNQSSRDVMAELTKVYSFAIDDKYNKIDRLEGGSYSHWVWDHNLLLKTIIKRFYDIKQDFTKTKHLSDQSIVSDKYSYSKNTLLSTVTTYPQVHNGILEDAYGRVLTNKIPLFDQLNTIKMDIVVNGRTDLEVGDIIDLSIGGMEVLRDEDKSKPATDNYNGNYLVVSILHRVTPKKHQMVIQVVKESVKEKYA